MHLHVLMGNYIVILNSLNACSYFVLYTKLWLGGVCGFAEGATSSTSGTVFSECQLEGTFSNGTFERCSTDVLPASQNRLNYIYIYFF